MTKPYYEQEDEHQNDSVFITDVPIYDPTTLHENTYAVKDSHEETSCLDANGRYNEQDTLGELLSCENQCADDYFSYDDFKYNADDYGHEVFNDCEDFADYDYYGECY